jgi:signal transduction histidine kinase
VRALGPGVRAAALVVVVVATVLVARDDTFMGFASFGYPLARRVSATSGVTVRVETTGDARPLLPDLEETLYRVAQEALANAEKHAKASRIGVTLSYADDLVRLDIVDDGIGFRPGDRGDGTGFGLEAMRQRVRRVAGTLSIESAPGGGTAVNAQVPAL